MAFHQVKDIIEESCSNHRKVAEYYDDMQEHFEEGKVKMLLQNMKEQEEKITHCIKMYLNDSNSTLETWFQYLPPLPDVNDLIREDLSEETSEDDVLHLFDEISNCFAIRYAKLSEISQSEAVYELFEKMTELEKYEQTRESWIKTMMDDM